MKCFINKLLGNIENSENLPKILLFVIWYGLSLLLETPVFFAVKGDCIATIETEGVTFCTKDGTPLTNLLSCKNDLYLIPNKEIKIVIDNVWGITSVLGKSPYYAYVFDINIFKYSNHIESLWPVDKKCTGSASIFLHLKLMRRINLSSSIKDLNTSYFKDLTNAVDVILSNSFGTLMDFTKLKYLEHLRVSTYNEDGLLFFKELIKNGYPQGKLLIVENSRMNINGIKYSDYTYYFRHDGTTIYVTGTNVNLQFPIN